MSSSVKIKTPLPSSSEVAERYGIGAARRTSISTIARDTVSKYYAGKSSGTVKKTAVKKKAA